MPTYSNTSQQWAQSSSSTWWNCKGSWWTPYTSESHDGDAPSIEWTGRPVDCSGVNTFVHLKHMWAPGGAVNTQQDLTTRIDSLCWSVQTLGLLLARAMWKSPIPQAMTAMQQQQVNQDILRGCKHNTSNDPFSAVQKCAVNGYREELTITTYSLTTSAQLD